MISATFRSPTRPAWLFCLSALLAGFVPPLFAQGVSSKPAAASAEETLVRVNIITETRGKSESVVINGNRIENYHPTIVQLFPSTGIVIDEQGHVLTFLGYQWVEIQTNSRRIEVVTTQGQKYPGRMVGIDQTTGVAVVRSQGGKLPKTPLCEPCDIRGGVTVVTPILKDRGESKLFRAQVRSVGSAEDAGRGWEITINRQLPGIGEPLLDEDHRFIGYVASQRPSELDPAGAHTIVYPVSQLLNSANKILHLGGDIRTGWLGVFLDDAGPSSKPGVRIKSVLEASPAARAGLLPEDSLVRWNDTEIRNVRQLIRLVQDTPAGTRVDLALVRKGKEMRISPTIEARKEDQARGSFYFNFPEEITVPNSRFEGEVTLGESPSPDAPRMGIEIISLTEALAKHLELPVQAGLMISAVSPGMGGARAGLKVGDVIRSIDDRTILDPLSLSSYIRSRGWGSSVVVKVLRSGAERAMKVTLIRPSAP